MTAYIIKSSISLLLLFGLYWFLLRTEKLFVFNRFFLVASVVFSLVVPFISIPVNFLANPKIENFIPVYYQATPEDIRAGDFISDPAIGLKQYSQNIPVILFLLYISGVILYLIRFFRNLYLIGQKSRLSEKINFRGYQVYLTNDQKSPYCFFNRIFLNREDYHNGDIDIDLFNHEMEHARQSHSIDIVLIELVKIFYWFNPVYLLYERAIRMNHEFLADNRVICDNSDIKSYMDKLINFISSSNMSLTSGSSNSFTKMRLMMMMKSHSGNFNYGTRITITLCMVIIFFMLLSFKESKNQSSDTNLLQKHSGSQQNLVKGFVVGEDGKPVMLVTIIASFSGKGVQSDSEGRFELKDIQKETSLLVSGIGYKNQTIKPDFTSEMVIKMVKDPNYKGQVMMPDVSYYHQGDNVRIRMPDDKNLQSLIVIDDEISNYKGEITLIRDDIGLVKILKGKEATEKFGEKGKYGVIEIITKKRANELNLNTSPFASKQR